jgi:hypothetical protein
MKMGPISCLETSVQNDHFALRNIPEERRSRLRRGGSLKSHIAEHSFYILLNACISVAAGFLQQCYN